MQSFLKMQVNTVLYYLFYVLCMFKNYFNVFYYYKIFHDCKYLMGDKNTAICPDTAV